MTDEIRRESPVSLFDRGFRKFRRRRFRAALQIHRHVGALERQWVQLTVCSQFDGHAALIHTDRRGDVVTGQLAVDDDRAVNVGTLDQGGSNEGARLT